MHLVHSSATQGTAPRRSPVLYVALGFVATALLCVAQLYYFGKLQSVIAELDGFAFGFTVTFATSFLVFCWIAATRYLI